MNAFYKKDSVNHPKSTLIQKEYLAATNELKSN